MSKKKNPVLQAAPKQSLRERLQIKHEEIVREVPALHDEDMPAWIPLFAAFLLPIVIMLGILAGKSIYPFGSESFLRTDMYHQYAPFFAEFARILKNGRSLTYSFEIGLGTNFAALYAYYLSSPINWLVFLCPSSLIIEFMTYTIVLKIGLCGFGMAYYLHKHFRTNSLAIAMFGICYAMCGYVAAYSWNIMWMDCLWLAPLVLLGLERLVREGKPLLYVVSLGLAILTNYYIAIMICIFLVLYFICEMIILPGMTLKVFLHRGLLFAVYSLLAGGVACVMILPAYLALAGTASADSTFPSSLTSYFTIIEMVARQMILVDVEIGLDHWPNIYSGVACLFLLPAYVLNPRTPAKEKIVRVTLLFVMFLSFSLNIPNYIWHGMHFPNSLPCRQSFLYTIALLAMCYEGLRGLKDLTTKQIAACFWGDLALILILQPIMESLGSEIEYYTYYVTVLFLALYVLMIWLWKKQKLSEFTAICICLILVVVETGINMAVTSVTTTDRDEYWKNTENYQILDEMCNDMEDGGFYRTEKASRRTKNDASWVGYRSASIFSSATEAGISDFYKLFGMEGNTNAYSFTGATPLMESLLSVKYRISTAEMDTSELRDYVQWQDTTYLYQNNYTLPIGFMLPDDVSTYFEMYAGDAAEAQNAFVSLTADTAPVLDEIATGGSGSSFTFEVPEEGYVYVCVENGDVSEVTASVDGNYTSFSNVDRGYLLDLGRCYEGSEITVSDDEGNTMEATAYIFNEQAFIDWYNVISEQSFTVTEFVNDRKETRIEGTIEAEENGSLFFSIPYEEGWTVLVDGEEVEPESFINAFLSVFVPAGSHEITLVYHTPGLAKGLLVSILSVILIVLLTLFGGIFRKLFGGCPMPVLSPVSEEASADDVLSEDEILLEDEEYLDSPEVPEE